MLGERGLAIDFDMYAPGAQEVFSVEHVHVVSDDEEQVETIGIYSQKNRAEDAVKRASELDGFKHQVEGFSIVPVNIDRDYWEEGMSATGRKLTIGS